jgi:hypothetical protein
MVLDAKTKSRLNQEKLQNQYKKRAIVTPKNMNMFVLNVILALIGLITLSLGTIGIAILLKVQNGKMYDPNSADFVPLFKYYWGSHACSIVAGLGIFILILSIVNFIEDYISTKKRMVDKIIKEDQEKAAAIAAKNANMNIFQMLAMNAASARKAKS